MSGHSKWATIKHKKGAVDKARGKLFAKIARQLEVAARDGGGDPNSNATLRTVMLKAKAGQMTNDAIDRAIKRGTGEDDGGTYEAITYEGYAPGGVALLIDVLTDNRNRTGAEVRHVLTKHGGSLGEPGSVGYLFDKKGVLVVDAGRYSEDDLIPAIDAGAEDIALDDDVFEILTEPGDLASVREALAGTGVAIDSYEVVQRPRAQVPVPEDQAGKLVRLIDALEENDDVNAVHANFDVAADVLERVMAG